MNQSIFRHSFGVLLLLFLALFPLFASEFRLELMGKILAYLIFAIAIDLAWGYAGLLSLGHGVFFGLGGYMLALSFSIQNGVPSFMKRFNIEEIPLWMKPLESVPAAVVIGLALPALLSGMIGYFIFKSKVSGIYFSLITLALAALFQMTTINMQAYTGGFNGLMGLPRFKIQGEQMSMTSYYYLILIVVVLVYLFARWLTGSRFGKVVRAMSENESRLSFFSYNPTYFKIFVFMVSGFLAGLAGILYVPVSGFFSPQDVGIAMSTLAIVWVAIGGRGTLMGAAVGALLINWLSNLLSEQFPNLWQLMYGVIIVLVVLFFPDGLYGTIRNKWFSGRATQRG